MDSYHLYMVQSVLEGYIMRKAHQHLECTFLQHVVSMVHISLADQSWGRHAGTSIAVWCQRRDCYRLRLDMLGNISQIFKSMTTFSMQLIHYIYILWKSETCIKHGKFLYLQNAEFSMFLWVLCRLLENCRSEYDHIHMVIPSNNLVDCNNTSVIQSTS